MVSVSDRNPASLYTGQGLRPEKPNKIKVSSHSVYSFESETLPNVIGLRNKQDTPKVAETLRQNHFTPRTFTLGYPLSTQSLTRNLFWSIGPKEKAYWIHFHHSYNTFNQFLPLGQYISAPLIPKE